VGDLPNLQPIRYEAKDPTLGQVIVLFDRGDENSIQGVSKGVSKNETGTIGCSVTY